MSDDEVMAEIERRLPGAQIAITKPTGPSDYDRERRRMTVGDAREMSPAVRRILLRDLREIAGIRDPVLPSVPASLALIDDGGA